MKLTCLCQYYISREIYHVVRHKAQAACMLKCVFIYCLVLTSSTVMHALTRSAHGF